MFEYRCWHCNERTVHIAVPVDNLLGYLHCPAVPSTVLLNADALFVRRTELFCCEIGEEAFIFFKRLSARIPAESEGLQLRTARLRSRESSSHAVCSGWALQALRKDQGVVFCIKFPQ